MVFSFDSFHLIISICLYLMTIFILYRYLMSLSRYIIALVDLLRKWCFKFGNANNTVFWFELFAVFVNQRMVLSYLDNACLCMYAIHLLYGFMSDYSANRNPFTVYPHFIRTSWLLFVFNGWIVWFELLIWFINRGNGINAFDVNGVCFI